MIFMLSMSLSVCQCAYHEATHINAFYEYSDSLFVIFFYGSIIPQSLSVFSQVATDY